MRGSILLTVLVVAATASAAAGFAVGGGASAGEPQWVIRKLAVSGGPVAVNDRGQVLGYRRSSNSDVTRGWLWENGRVRDLGTLGGNRTWPTALNERGQVVGYSPTKSGKQHAFLWQNAKMTDIGPPGRLESRAVAINERGEVLIQTYRFDASLHADQDVGAWLWSGGKFTNVTLETGAALNDEGEVVGRSYDHAFR